MRNQLSILDVPVDAITMDEAVQRVTEFYSEPGLHTVVTVNAEMVMLAQQDKELHNILTHASLAVPDGAGVLWAAEQMGHRFPERVAGCDLAMNLLRHAAQCQVPVYVLGAAPGVAEKAVRNVEQSVGTLQIAGIHSGFFNADEEKEMISRVLQLSSLPVRAVMTVRRDLSPIRYEVLFGDRLLQVPLEVLRWPLAQERTHGAEVQA